MQYIQYDTNEDEEELDEILIALKQDIQCMDNDNVHIIHRLSRSLSTEEKEKIIKKNSNIQIPKNRNNGTKSQKIWKYRGKTRSIKQNELNQNGIKMKSRSKSSNRTRSKSVKKSVATKPSQHRQRNKKKKKNKKNTLEPNTKQKSKSLKIMANKKETKKN